MLVPRLVPGISMMSTSRHHNRFDAEEPQDRTRQWSLRQLRFVFSYWRNGPDHLAARDWVTIKQRTIRGCGASDCYLPSAARVGEASNSFQYGGSVASRKT